MEHWKAVVGYEGLYEVSDLGRFRSIGKRNGSHVGFMRGVLVCGYRRVVLHRHGKRKRAQLHRLLAEAFIGEIPPYMEVNHKNGIRSDNRLENIEIVTPRVNRLHAYRVLGQQRMQGSRHGRHKLTEEQVLEIRHLGANREHGIGTKLAKQFGVGPQIISFILNRKNWKHI